MDKPIATAGRTRQILEKYGLTARKGFGQNFMIEPGVVERMAALFGPGDVALEVGPGLGALTEALARHVHAVIAYEIDTGLRPVLAETLAPYDNVQVRWLDFMKADLDQEVAAIDPAYQVVMASNLPYYITTPILFRVLDGPARIGRVAVMMQREVAQRFLAVTGGKDYNALTVVSRYMCDVRLVANVPRQAFSPQPEVDSAIVLFTRRPYKRTVDDQAAFTALVRSCFAQRRKKLSNNLRSAGHDAPAVAAALAAVGRGGDVRAEQLDVDEFITIYEVMRHV